MSDANPIPPMPGDRPQRVRNPWKVATLCLSAALLATSVGLVYLLAAGSDGGDSSAGPDSSPSIWQDTRSPVAPSPDDSPSASPTPSGGAADGFKVGEEARNGGAVVTIAKVRQADAITTVEGGQQKAGNGAKYVILETVVFNDAKQSMDLTCSLPIANALLDDQGRRYDTIEELDEVKGNPECNDQLQPGFKDRMQFVYRVPEGVKATAWEFAEFDLDGERESSVIQLGGATTSGT
ncbi:DUF4352 domain-containing protein [Streptomyces sp. NPDC002851]